MANETPGVVATPQAAPSYGRQGDYIFFDDDALVWVSRAGDYVNLDTASGLVVRDGDYLRIGA